MIHTKNIQELVFYINTDYTSQGFKGGLENARLRCRTQR